MHAAVRFASVQGTLVRRAGSMTAMLALCLGPISQSAKAQALSVLPVNVQMAPGQGAATITVTNRGDQETSVQVRAFSWAQAGDEDKLTPSDALLVSPPISTIAPGGTQLVRLVLRKPPQDKESTYRIVLDQIPPPAVPGVVRVVLRISIPVFSQPLVRALPHLQFQIAHDAGKAYLVASNDGSHHEVLRDIVISTADGNKIKVGAGVSPYILAGSVRRWPLELPESDAPRTDTLHLSAREDSGTINQQVQVDAP